MTLQPKQIPVYTISSEQQERLLALCAHWAEQHPSFSDRLAKARLLLIDSGVTPTGPYAWLVRSSEGEPHRVLVINGAASCSCEWSRHGGTHCSHALACGLAHKIFGVYVAPEPPKKTRKPVRLSGLTIKRSMDQLEQHLQRQALARPVGVVLH